MSISSSTALAATPPASPNPMFSDCPYLEVVTKPRVLLPPEQDEWHLQSRQPLSSRAVSTAAASDLTPEVRLVGLSLSQALSSSTDTFRLVSPFQGTVMQIVLFDGLAQRTIKSGRYVQIDAVSNLLRTTAYESFPEVRLRRRRGQRRCAPRRRIIRVRVIPVYQALVQVSMRECNSSRGAPCQRAARTITQNSTQTFSGSSASSSQGSSAIPQFLLSRASWVVRR